MCGFRSLTSSDRQARPFFLFFIFTVKHVHAGGQPPLCWRPLRKHCFLYIIRSSSRSLSDLANFQSQVWLAVSFFSLFKPFPSSAPPRACLYSPPPATFHRWLEGGEGRWQGSLHHKTPAGHCPQQLPHGITASLSASEWTGPVCHIADTRKWGGGSKGREEGRRNHGKQGGGNRKWDMFQERKCMMGTLLNPAGQYRCLSHAEMLDICISLTQIIFARTWKNCKKSKVRPAWRISHWSLPPQSLRLYRRGLTFLPSCDCTESHIRRGSFRKKERKKKKHDALWWFRGGQGRSGFIAHTP